MQYVFTGQILNVDMEDGKAAITFDCTKVNDELMQKFAKLGVRTKIRNYTAGKQGTDARNAVVEGIKQLYDNKWGPEPTSKIVLSEAELQEVAVAHMVNLKLASGDQRPAEAIATAFTGLPEARQTELFAQHKRAIKKAQAVALDRKKGKVVKIDPGF